MIIDMRVEKITETAWDTFVELSVLYMFPKEGTMLEWWEKVGQFKYGR